MTSKQFDAALEAIGEMMRLAQDEDDEREVRDALRELQTRALCAGFGARCRAEVRA